jgi:hypothetical protein
MNALANEERCDGFAANRLGEMFSPLTGAHFSRLGRRLPFSVLVLSRANSPILDLGEINSLAHTPKIKGASEKKKPWEIAQSMRRRDVIYENSVDRRVGVGVTVVVRGVRREPEGRGRRREASN